MSVIIFWSILAIGFLLLAFLSWYATKKPLKQLKEFSDHPSGIFIKDDETEEKFKLETSLYQILNCSAWVNFVAFLLAAVAAVLSFR